jgi:thioesterase domain-containing protein
MEHHLREAWTDALGSEPPNRHASFFDCGGHSLSAMRFALSLKRRLHLSQVPAPLVFKYPTLAGLGEALLSPLEGSGLRFTSVIKRGHRTPLILVHPVQGISQAYRALAGHLHDRTIITIDSPRMGQPSGFRSLQEMAALYVEWARSLTDDKPVILGGWSFGGAVALEMGLILARHGTAPAGLVLIDSFNFTGKSALAGKLTAAAEATLSNLEAVDRVTREVVQQEIRHNTFLAFGASSDRFDKPCLLIQARGGEPGANLEPENGWRRDQLPRLRVVPAASDHHNILSPEFVAETAGMLDSFMSEMD